MVQWLRLAVKKHAQLVVRINSRKSVLLVKDGLDMYIRVILTVLIRFGFLVTFISFLNFLGIDARLFQNSSTGG
ncbi:hypothetical protein C5167_015198 [Papaver somniferum]|uniref:Uncharacterized protein n=1 Tax=Papaver somniferum TaxID=3469 RepID=A0A4Y7J8S9_PAPSO|nr:hypothetical protein C5167_015198 [Papaver somniferum]